MTEVVTVQFIGGPLDGEIRAVRAPVPEIYTVVRLAMRDARYRFDGRGVYRFMGESA